PYWIRLMDIIKELSVEVKLGSHYTSQEEITDHVHMNFDIFEKNEIINITSTNKTGVLIPSHGYVVVDQIIYQLDKNHFHYFKVIHEALIEHQNKITIEQSFKHNFASSILPVLKEMGTVNLGPQINKTLYTDTLVVEIYLDEYQNTLKGTITFNYGDYQLHILPRDTSMIPEHVTIIQDLKKEAELMNLLKSSYCVFDASNEYFTIIKEDYLYDFIYVTLPALQEIATVYYSDAFKQLHIKHPSGFQGGVSVSSSGMLDFSFEIDGVLEEEIHEVIRALRNKQKYFRLKNGQFLPLEQENYIKMNELLEELDLYDVAEKNALIQIPLYRAFTLNHLMKEASNKSFHKSRTFKQLLDDIKEPSDIELQVPTELRATLRPYQETGFKWLKALNQYGFGGILADDMGLGKTIQAITLILSTNTDKPSIVIAPTSLIYNWGSEIKRFAPELRYLIVTGGKEKREQHIQNQLMDFDIIITSYGAAKRDIALYEAIDFEFCIIDEAQHIKNHLSQNALAVKLIRAKTKLALTGTPIENNISELWSIFDFIMPGYLGNHKYFLTRYEKPITKENSPVALKQLIEQISPLLLRRLKKDVLLELPPKIETTMYTELSHSQKTMYLSILEQTRNALSTSIKEDGYGKNAMKIFAALTKLRQICCHPKLIDDTYEGGSNKLALLEELLLDAIESGHRLLIFSSFTGMLKLIRELMAYRKIGYFYLDGQTKAEDRLEMTKMFNNGDNEVFLISLKAGGTGLNLTGADMVIHYDPWWNPAAEEQATDRAYRIGQNKSVQVIKLLTTGTIEEKIFALQEQKKSLIDSVITPGETFINHLSETELLKLFNLDSLD
ncbi:MAG: DEAD/DEAH box helicase, partial [Vallitaleaceae bacterium]|nr:DEAD/DEAH box helicase [Vallitaleaceae bacterium]